jgi:hypothetical protein
MPLLLSAMLCNELKLSLQQCAVAVAARVKELCPQFGQHGQNHRLLAGSWANKPYCCSTTDTEPRLLSHSCHAESAVQPRVMPGVAELQFEQYSAASRSEGRSA